MNNGHMVRRILGVPIDALTMNQVLDLAEQAIQRRQPLQIGVVNAAKVVNMHRDDLLRQAVLSSDVILADGMSVVWASRLLRQPLPQRVAGIDLMMGLFERANDRGYGVYCLGATDEVITRVVDMTKHQYPGMRLAGYHNGYFRPDEECEIVQAIAASKPDILFVAMTSPKKEEFLARWSRQLQVPVCHGVGGSFDVLAGRVARAPRAWQRLGMEWLYRVIQEPRRMWRRYLVTNTLFGYMLAGELFASRREKPSRLTAE